jgi:F-type H+-transporting ATPase subunit a
MFKIAEYKELSKKIVFYSLFVFFVLGGLSFNCQAHNHEHETSHNHHEEKEAKKFNAGKMIFEHINDAYDWHIMDINDHPVSISLPVIAYHPEKGLDVFSSAKLEHGHAEYNGYQLNYIEGENRFKLATTDGSKFYDLSITKNVFAMFIASILLLIIGFTVAKGYKKRTGKAPKGLQSFLEPIILFVRDEIAKASIGEKYFQRFLPFLLTLFFFIFLNNLLGLVPFFPGGANVTGNIAVTGIMALFVFLITIFSAKKDYWKHIFVPDVPVALYPLIILIEVFGMFLKPLVLMLRLFANITAGHIIILGFFSMIFIFGELNQGLGYGVSVFSIAFTVFMSLLELLVAFLQAYVFTLLAALYFGMAVEEHHHAEKH